MPAGRFRIGLLVDGSNAHQWVADLCSWARDHPRITLAARIVVPPPTRRPAIERLLRLESRLLRATPELRGFGQIHSLADCAPLEIRLARSDRSGRVEVDAVQASVLEGLGLDALVACGRVPPGHALQRFARGGVLHVRTGDGGQRDEAGTGLSELVAGKTATPFVIEREHADGRRDALFTGSVATALFLAWNFTAVQARAFGYLRLVLERLASGDPLAPAPAAARSGPSFPDNGPGGRAMHPPVSLLVAYALRTTWRSAAKAARRLLGKEFNWQVAFSRRPWWNCDRAKATRIASPAGAFLADPFAIRFDGRDYLFVEEFPFATRKGVISAYELVGDRAQRIGPVLEEPWHLSFPFVFSHGGEMFMVPESGADRSIKLYRSAAFPGGWSLATVLMRDVPAVDSILFEHDGRWWLFTTIKGDGPALNNADLHAFHAPDLFGPWTAHRCNPIVMDATRGRNGGFLRDAEGAPCRVAQVPGFTFYGEQAAIFRIEELTPDRYRERLVKVLAPDFAPGLDGTHHMSGSAELTLFDFMRVERPRSRRARGSRNGALGGARASTARFASREGEHE